MLFDDVSQPRAGRRPSRAALGELGVDLDRLRGARARCRARQRRPRPARRLLHGEHGDARHSRARLRHPLRPRHLPPGHARRLAAGICRRSGSRSAIRGSSSGRRSPTTIGFGGTVEDASTGRRAPRARLASGGDRRRGRLRHADRRAGAAGTSTRCGCGRRARPIRCGSTTSTAATMSARSPSACGSRRSRACSIRATRPPAGQRPAAAAGISSSPRRRCRTWCAATCAPRRPALRCPTTSRSSSTTRIRHRACPS